VILVDANLLLYAYDTSFEQHRPARRWLEATLSGREPVRLAWATLLAFLRIGTNPRAFEQPLSIDEAVKIVAAWLACPLVAIAEPGERHWEILARLLSATVARGPLVMDAHLAALALEHGATLYTTDRDFVRFPDVRVLNPLTASA
jgi:toxin-antitoxin system PIN domain toxin